MIPPNNQGISQSSEMKHSVCPKQRLTFDVIISYARNLLSQVKKECKKILVGIINIEKEAYANMSIAVEI